MPELPPGRPPPGAAGPGDPIAERRRALLLLLVVLAACLGPLAVSGLPVSMASSAQDGDATVLWLHGFAAGLAEGRWWPRWLPEGNRGFGSPAFLFYPPMAYWAAAAIELGLRLDEARALVLAAMLWRLASAGLAYLWLRRWMRREAALFGTALFALHVQTMLVNPLVRFAYAEMAGGCILLLALLAAGARRPLAWVPPAFALLVVTHLPTAVLAGGVLPAWSLVAAGAGWEGLRRAAATFAGCILGAALVAAYLLPALMLLPEINPKGWAGGGNTIWPAQFLMARWTPALAPVQFVFMNAGLAILPASLAALAWVGRRRAPAWRDRFFLAGTALAVVLCVLATPLSWRVWALLPPLQWVQFPWRFLVLAVPLWAMLAGRRLDRLAGADRRAGGRLAAATAILLGAFALWVPYSAAVALLPGFERYGWTRLHFAPPGPRAMPLVNPPEFAPRAAVLAGWRAEEPATDAPLLERLERSASALPELRLERGEGGLLRLDGRADARSELVLPQFAFPGWSLAGEPAGAALSIDSETGLLLQHVPAGRVALRVFRVATPAERAGWAASAATLLAWLGLLLGCIKLRRRRGGPVMPES